jgi:hypothetical protein
LLTRRTFLGWLGAIGSAIGLGARERGPADRDRSQAGALDTERVIRLGEAVLPEELGDLGTARISRGFVQWAASMREGAELVHPYGSTDIRYAGPPPTGRWRSQLDELDRASRTAHQRPFGAATVEQRRELVRQALASDAAGRLPDPGAARHVAVALLAWFYASPDATNLCYQARIDASQCRPLGQSSRQPLPLARPGAGSGDDGGRGQPS